MSDILFDEDVSIPEELIELIVDFILSVLTEKPSDVYMFAQDYFSNLANLRKSNKSMARVSAADDDRLESSVESLSPRWRRKSIIPEYYNPEDDHDFEKERIVHPKTNEERSALQKILSGIYLFRDMNDDEMSVLIDAFEPKYVSSGEVVIEMGDEGDLFYVIEYGRFEATSRLTVLKVYDNSGYFGELALMYNHPRLATIRALSDGKLWCIDRHTFRRSVTQAAYTTRKMYLSFIDDVPLFNELTTYEKCSIAEGFTLREFEDGSNIFEQGDDAENMYFIVEGKVSIKITHEGVSRIVKVCEKGDYFGELALLTKQPRAASAFAIGHTKLAELDVMTFERVLGKCVDIMKRNMKTYFEVLQEAFGAESISDDWLR